MRTQEQIVERIDDECKNNLLASEVIDDLIVYLDFDHARKYLKAECTPELWAKDKKEYLPANILQSIQEYMPFAMMKAENQRGISASRSIMHFCNWLWLLEDEELYAFAMDDDNYPEYGMPILVKIQAKYPIKPEATPK